MRLLLDTHALAWWTEDNEQLTGVVRAAVQNEASTVYVSAVSVYEMAAKHQLGKWPEASELLRLLNTFMSDQYFLPLPLRIDHALRAGGLPMTHRDPFDRMLIAQALVDDLTLVSNEEVFDRFGVRRLW